RLWDKSTAWVLRIRREWTRAGSQGRPDPHQWRETLPCPSRLEACFLSPKTGRIRLPCKRSARKERRRIQRSLRSSIDPGMKPSRLYFPTTGEPVREAPPPRRRED